MKTISTTQDPLASPTRPRRTYTLDIDKNSNPIKSMMLRQQNDTSRPPLVAQSDNANELSSTDPRAAVQMQLNSRDS